MDDQALKDYFQFDDYDLAANRNGRLSTKQQQKLTREYAEVTNFGLKLGLPALALAVLLLLVSIVFFKQLGPNVYFTIILMLICIGLAFYGLRNSYNARQTVVLEGFTRVQRLEGPVHIKESGQAGIAYLDLSGEQWVIDAQLAATLHPGDIYVVYFGGENGDLLSLEWIATDA
jgi:hypothetical protein